jgi:hypothetical protein
MSAFRAENWRSDALGTKVDKRKFKLTEGMAIWEIKTGEGDIGGSEAAC